MTGIAPITLPIVRLPHLVSVHLPKAPTGPASAQRPSANSSIMPEDAIRITNSIYTIRNVIPPYFDTMIGNRQMLPIPTAEPIHAIIKPVLVLNRSLSIKYSSSIPPESSAHQRSCCPHTGRSTRLLPARGLREYSRAVRASCGRAPESRICGRSAPTGS